MPRSGLSRRSSDLDWLPYDDLNLMGVESLTVDPSDPDRLYLACGTYTNAGTPDGAVLRSADPGRTFQRANVPFKMGANENGRGNGERLAVDPNDGRVLFLGTRHAGLWRSGDGAATWSRVESFPEVTEVLPPKPPDEPPWVQRGGSGGVFVVFDPRRGRRGSPTPTLYAGVSLMGRDDLFRSTDAGETWKAVPGHPTAYRPNHAVLASDGTLYVSYGTNPGDVDSGRPTTWSVMSSGIEETFALDLLSPPRGVPLLTAVGGDHGGFVHRDLGRPAPEGAYDHPHFGNTTGLACAENAPDVLVRVGRASLHRGGGHIGYSLDGGETWQPPAPTPAPDSQLGHVAVSSAPRLSPRSRSLCRTACQGAAATAATTGAARTATTRRRAGRATCGWAPSTGSTTRRTRAARSRGCPS